MLRISTLVHGVIDYVVGAGLIAAPEAIGLTADAAATNFTRAMGGGAIGYALCTDYELGALKLIPMAAHLRVDSGWALGLALGPWVLGFARRGLRFWLPHAIVAATAGAVIALSRTQVSGKQTHKSG